MTKEELKPIVENIIEQLYQIKNSDPLIVTQNKQFGDLSVVLFKISKLAKKAPDTVATQIAEELQKVIKIKEFEVYKGFLNLKFEENYGGFPMEQFFD